MENLTSQTENFPDYDSNLNNIISINNSNETDEDIQDYDFDYDPNEMFWALNGK